MVNKSRGEEGSFFLPPGRFVHRVGIMKVSQVHYKVHSCLERYGTYLWVQGDREGNGSWGRDKSDWLTSEPCSMHCLKSNHPIFSVVLVLNQAKYLNVPPVEPCVDNYKDQLKEVVCVCECALPPFLSTSYCQVPPIQYQAKSQVPKSPGPQPSSFPHSTCPAITSLPSPPKRPIRHLIHPPPSLP